MAVLTFLPQLISSGLAVGSLYALVALGFSVIFAATRVINFAQGELVLAGALAAYTLHVLWGLPMPVAFGAAALAGALLGLLTERLAVAPFRQMAGSHAWIMSTLGLGLLRRSFAQRVWGTSALALPSPFGTGRLEVAGVSLLQQEVATAAVAFALMFLLEWMFLKTILGRALRAVAYHLDAARLMGIPPVAMYLFAFALSGALSGIAGFLISPITGINADMGIPLAIKGFAAATLGGLGVCRGALIGGLVLGVAETLAGGLLWAGFHDIFAFLVLLAALLVRPQGIFARALPVRV